MSEVRTERIYGWYDRPDQPVDQPTFNPSFPGPCLFCGNETSESDVRTHSLMAMDGARSFFYRTHRTCHESADDTARNAIDQVVWDAIAHHGDGPRV
jgi:hypothetical protein